MVFKRTVSMRRFFLAPNTCLMMGKGEDSANIFFTIKKLLTLAYEKQIVHHGLQNVCLFDLILYIPSIIFQL